jgi:ribonucleoside-triphosphate reductase
MKTKIPVTSTSRFLAVTKRDGSRVSFDGEKIVRALSRAGLATKEYNEPQAVQLSEKVIRHLEKTVLGDIVSIEQIQDAAEHVLMISSFKATAKAYILYRDQHAEMRSFATMSSLGLVDNYLDKLDWQVKENSNMGYSLQGLNNYIFSEVSKTYWLNKIYPQEIRSGFCFGEAAIINNTSRNASAMASTEVDLFTLDSIAFNISFGVLSIFYRRNV